MEKRNSRADVIIDEDDLVLLFLIPPLPSFQDLSIIKDKMNISHNSLLIHLNRLLAHGLINFGRSNDNYKFKIIHMTTSGEKMRKELLKSPDVVSRLNKFEIKDFLKEHSK
jgi:DNA-binding MarR family transcriptional regulator